MAKVLIKANVAFLDEFLDVLAGFDRKPYGELSFTADIDDNAHNQVYVTFNWNTLRDARDFWTSRIGLAHIGAWHSVSTPEFVYLRNLPTESQE